MRVFSLLMTLGIYLASLDPLFAQINMFPREDLMWEHRLAPHHGTLTYDPLSAFQRNGSTMTYPDWFLRAANATNLLYPLGDLAPPRFRITTRTDFLGRYEDLDNLWKTFNYLELSSTFTAFMFHPVAFVDQQVNDWYPVFATLTEGQWNTSYHHLTQNIDNKRDTLCGALQLGNFMLRSFLEKDNVLFPKALVPLKITTETRLVPPTPWEWLLHTGEYIENALFYQVSDFMVLVDHLINPQETALQDAYKVSATFDEATDNFLTSVHYLGVYRASLRLAHAAVGWLPWKASGSAIDHLFASSYTPFLTLPLLYQTLGWLSASAEGEVLPSWVIEGFTLWAGYSTFGLSPLALLPHLAFYLYTHGEEVPAWVIEGVTLGIGCSLFGVNPLVFLPYLIWLHYAQHTTPGLFA